MASARGEHTGRQISQNSPSTEMEALLADTYTGFPTDLRSDYGEPSQPLLQSPGMAAELRLLLQALPTKADIAALIDKVETAHRKELSVMKADVQALTTRVEMGESSLAALERRVSAVEGIQDTQAEALQDQQLHMEEMEDRSRRNNL